MSAEADWVKTLGGVISTGLESSDLSVETGFRLPYALDIRAHKTKPDRQRSHEIEGKDFRWYQTDLLISEVTTSEWIPRVVVEFKLGGITTRDVLTYSAKAATHKSLYPHLRYGVVIGEWRLLPPKLLWHGHHFDFMLALETNAMAGVDCKRLCELLRQEVEASRALGRLQLSRAPKVSLIHRKLISEP